MATNKNEPCAGKEWNNNDLKRKNNMSKLKCWSTEHKADIYKGYVWL